MFCNKVVHLTHLHHIRRRPTLDLYLLIIIKLLKEIYYIVYSSLRAHPPKYECFCCCANF